MITKDEQCASYTREINSNLDALTGTLEGMDKAHKMAGGDLDRKLFGDDICRLGNVRALVLELSTDAQDALGALRHHKRKAEAKDEEFRVLRKEMNRKLSDAMMKAQFNIEGYDNLMDVLVDAIEAVDLTLDDLEMAKSKGALKAKHAGILNPSISHLRDRQKRFNEVFEHHIKRRASLSQAVIDNYHANKESADEK